MSANKKRDVANDLVQFLADEKKSQAEKPLPDLPSHSRFVIPDLESEQGELVQEKSEVVVVPEAAPENLKPTVGKTDFKFGQSVAAKIESVAGPAPKPVPVSAPASAPAAPVQDLAALVGGLEALKTAQARITTLEKERDTLRDEIDKLVSISENLQRRVADQKASHDGLERKYREKVEVLEEEKIVTKNRLTAREQELTEARSKVSELENRFQNDLRKIRVRERELENRNMLIKSEIQAVMQSKDEMILELRRQLEQVSFELDNFRAKSSELNTKINELNDRNQKTVKALRLALSVLESGEGS